MSENSSRCQVLHLTTLFVCKNKEFTEAMKEKKPIEHLKAIHSEIQEIYNHISLLKQLHSHQI